MADITRALLATFKAEFCRNARVIVNALPKKKLEIIQNCCVFYQNRLHWAANMEWQWNALRVNFIIFYYFNFKKKTNFVAHTTSTNVWTSRGHWIVRNDEISSSQVENLALISISSFSKIKCIFGQNTLKMISLNNVAVLGKRLNRYSLMPDEFLTRVRNRRFNPLRFNHLNNCLIISYLSTSNVFQTSVLMILFSLAYHIHCEIRRIHQSLQSIAPCPKRS